MRSRAGWMGGQGKYYRGIAIVLFGYMGSQRQIGTKLHIHTSSLRSGVWARAYRNDNSQAITTNLQLQGFLFFGPQVARGTATICFGWAYVRWFRSGPTK